jgi:type IV secretory pathway VirB10-like protein
MDMKKCLFCETNMPGKFRICPYCGRRQSPIVWILVFLVILAALGIGYYTRVTDRTPFSRDVSPPEEKSVIPEQPEMTNPTQDLQKETGQATGQGAQEYTKKERIGWEKAAREQAEKARRERKRKARKRASSIRADRERLERERAASEEKARQQKEQDGQSKVPQGQAEEEIRNETAPGTVRPDMKNPLEGNRP